MTRLEIDIDCKNTSNNNPVVKTDLRIVRECTTGKKNAEMETRIARILRMGVVDILQTCQMLDEKSTKEVPSVRP